MEGGQRMAQFAGWRGKAFLAYLGREGGPFKGNINCSLIDEMILQQVCKYLFIHVILTLAFQSNPSKFKGNSVALAFFYIIKERIGACVTESPPQKHLKIFLLAMKL
jgi:hypothetical protein